METAKIPPAWKTVSFRIKSKNYLHEAQAISGEREERKG